MTIDTIPARLLKQAETRPHATAYAVYTGGGWQKFNWDTFATNTKQAARALLTLGIEAGNPICIMSFNCPEWVIADVGAMMIGAVPAGIYQTCSAPEVEYILNHSESPVVFLESEEHWEKVAGLWSIKIHGIEPMPLIAKPMWKPLWPWPWLMI